MALIKLTLALTLAVMITHNADAKNMLSGISAETLLNICMEGDNDSREGVIAEMECEQYISGFLDAYIVLNNKPELCLPAPGNRPDEVRWVYTKWVHKHFGKRKQSAAKLLLAAVSDKFKCK